MPGFVSGLRIARSYITPGNAAESRELDFQLGAQEGIAIFGLLATMHLPTITTTTLFTNGQYVQTLHLETGSLEIVPFGSGADEDTIDSEEIFRQDLTLIVQDEAALRGGSAVSMMITPNGLITFPEAIFTARNITHRAEGTSDGHIAGCHLLIYYKFVKFSLSEMGVLLARRA